MSRLLVAGGLLAALACQQAAPSGAQQRLQHLRQQQEKLWASFNEKVAGDPVLAGALAEEGELLLGFREQLLQGMLREVAERYLDRVDLDLPLDEAVRADGEVKVKTRLGMLNAGSWTLDLVIHRVRGTLRARTPTVELPAADRVGVTLPVLLQEGRGSATVHFAWNARGIANFACRDFTVTRKLEGEVVADEYTVKGALVLSAAEDHVEARPDFPESRFRIKVRLTPTSWQEVQAALDEQDKLLKCGLALKPEEMLAKVDGVLARGFNVKLPRSLFRSVRLPAGFQREVHAEDRRLDLGVETRGLHLAQGALWYSAAVAVREGRAAEGR